MPDQWLDDEDGRLQAVHAYITEMSEEPNLSFYDYNDTLTDEQQPIAITSEMYINEIYPNRMDQDWFIVFVKKSRAES